jgi:hypothetical protein
VKNKVFLEENWGNGGGEKELIFSSFLATKDP